MPTWPRKTQVLGRFPTLQRYPNNSYLDRNTFPNLIPIAKTGLGGSA
ncbi:hypothetical protein SUS17_108 [Sphingomonas sp. S17]|nr:hypothetical protein SUS17_108 [Sphingomonas sp. S17]